jgi:hypothetical protein
VEYSADDNKVQKGERNCKLAQAERQSNCCKGLPVELVASANKFARRFAQTVCLNSGEKRHLAID